MSMVYTLVSSAKDWLSERFAQATEEGVVDDEATKEEVRFFFSLLSCCMQNELLLTANLKTHKSKISVILAHES